MKTYTYAKKLLNPRRWKLWVLSLVDLHTKLNPPTAIKTFSEYLPQKLEDKEFLQKFSRIVGGEVNRIDALVNELLEFAKPAPLQLKHTNINKLISDTLDFLNSRFLQQSITIEKNLSAECNEPTPIDPNKIKQVLLSIFLNAIEAMPGGGVLNVSTVIASRRARQSHHLQRLLRHKKLFLAMTI